MELLSFIRFLSNLVQRGDDTHFDESRVVGAVYLSKSEPCKVLKVNGDFKEGSGIISVVTRLFFTGLVRSIFQVPRPRVPVGHVNFALVG